MTATKLETKAERILEKWGADLAKKDRRLSFVSGNFEELFYELHRNSVPFNIAHGLIERAVRFHHPSNSVAKITYKKMKAANLTSASEKEYIDEWKKTIKDKGMQAFYDYYNIDGDDAKKEPAQYGSMSKEEYHRQRRYADKFPELDTEGLEQLQKSGEYNIDEILKIVENLEEVDDQAK